MSVVLVVAAMVFAQVDPSASPPSSAPYPSSPSSSEAYPAPGPADASSQAAPQPLPAPEPEPEPPLGKWGLILDAGLPDGFSVSALFRPAHFFRLSAGGAYNIIGYGVRGGVSLVPFNAVVTPSLNLDAGYFFEADATAVIQRVLPQIDLAPVGDIPRHVSYQYATASLGLELGSPQKVVFFLRVGISYLQSTIKGFEAILRTFDPTVEAKDPTLRATIPALKLGIILYF
jgi:hypothetical protein